MKAYKMTFAATPSRRAFFSLAHQFGRTHEFLRFHAGETLIAVMNGLNGCLGQGVSKGAHFLGLRPFGVVPIERQPDDERTDFGFGGDPCHSIGQIVELALHLFVHVRHADPGVNIVGVGIELKRFIEVMEGPENGNWESDEATEGDLETRDQTSALSRRSVRLAQPAQKKEAPPWWKN